MKNQALSVIDQKSDLIAHVNDAIWEYAELSLKEHKSMALYCKVLEDEGFKVEKEISGVPTAFSGTYGAGKPVIGILAEYDALSGLSQEAACTTHKPIVSGGHGHGCGHNQLGAGSLAAALAVKKYLELKGGSGTVVFYGCPGEEGGAGKAFMAREKEFEKLDAAFCWHPGDVNAVSTGSCNCSIQIEFIFHGIAAHAAGSPHMGRSALDAVELMNTGVQYLREHIKDSDRIHYAITDAGGVSPNVVQAKAKVLYMVRSNNVKNGLALVEKVRTISKAAAMMTETTVTEQFIDGTADLVPNFTLEKLLYQEFDKLGVPQYTADEFAWAQKLVDSYENPEQGLPGRGYAGDPDLAAFIKEHSQDGTKSLNDFLIPYKSNGKMSMGSTDVGDVSWQTPTAQIGVVGFTSKAPGHSWQNVSASCSSVAHKGIVHAGKVLAAATIELFEHPEIITEAKAEFREKAADGYTCPIPPDAVPVAID